MPESFSWYFLPWWAQKSSSPLSSSTRMYACAPQLSQRSSAVSENCDSSESSGPWSPERVIVTSLRDAELVLTHVSTRRVDGCVMSARRSLNAKNLAVSGGAERRTAVSARAVTVAGMASSDYSARHLSVLEGLEAVRKRPGMYIGSTDSRGLMHCLWEIIDNSVDEALAGHGDRIEVVLHPDASVEVRDTARGIPVDIEPKTGLSGVEVVFTKLHAGGKFGSGSYAASGGLHGVGASVVNALSERLDVEVDRDGKTWAMSFHRGEPGIFADEGEPRPDAPFTPFVAGSELRVVGKVAKGKTGTRIRYWADRQIFGRDASFQPDGLVARARQTAFLVPGLGITIDDQ